MDSFGRWRQHPKRIARLGDSFVRVGIIAKWCVGGVWVYDSGQESYTAG